MAGSKKNKGKKAPASAPPVAPPPENTMDDEDLMEDLMAQLDSKNSTVQGESAAVLNEMQLRQDANADSTDVGPSSSAKQDSRARYKARQVRAPAM